MRTDWSLVDFQAWWALVPLLCTVGLGWFVNSKIEHLKTALLFQQTVRNEKKEAYFQVLRLLGEMRHTVGLIQADPASGAVETAYSKLSELRQELYRIAPCVIMVLNTPAVTAIEAYRKTAESALQLNPATPERWKREGEAIQETMTQLIKDGRSDLGYLKISDT